MQCLASLQCPVYNGKTSFGSSSAKASSHQWLICWTKSQPNPLSILGVVISARDQSVHHCTLMRVCSIFRSWWLQNRNSCKTNYIRMCRVTLACFWQAWKGILCVKKYIYYKQHVSEPLWLSGIPLPTAPEFLLSLLGSRGKHGIHLGMLSNIEQGFSDLRSRMRSLGTFSRCHGMAAMHWGIMVLRFLREWNFRELKLKSNILITFTCYCLTIVFF